MTNWTAKEYDDYRKRKTIAKVRIANTPANVESDPSNGSLEEKEAPRFDRPVHIAYIETRNRLADSDGSCTKYTTDSLIENNVLRDDGPQEIPRRPSHVQQQGKHERTVIEIYEEVEIKPHK